MKKYLIFLSCLATLLSTGCDNIKKTDSTPTPVIISLEEEQHGDTIVVDIVDEEIVEEEAEQTEFHMGVDLGLPSGTVWSATNLGASSSSDFGDYYAMGEIKPSKEYTPVANTHLRDYPSGVMIERHSSFDAATHNWGLDWKMPVDSEFYELQSQCVWILTTENGNNGYRIVGPNGYSIFLPFAGYKTQDYRGIDKIESFVTSVAENKEGYYWKAPRYECKYRNPETHLYLNISQSGRRIETHSFHDGLSIRPVSKRPISFDTIIYFIPDEIEFNKACWDKEFRLTKSQVPQYKKVMKRKPQPDRISKKSKRFSFS